MVALAALASTTVPGASAEKPLNVVLILADDLGWADIASHGGDLHETPHLDRLTSQGLRFTQAYAASVCSPSRASLITGKHNARLHITTWRENSRSPVRNRRLIPPMTASDLPLSEVTLAEMLHGAGYLTAIVGKWHLGDAAFYPEAQGFDINIGGTLWGAPHTYFYPYRGSNRPGAEFRYVPHLEGGSAGEYLTDRLTEEALRIIDSAGEKPFFLYLAHHAVHTPIEAKPDLVRHFEQKLTPGLHHRNPRYAAMLASLDQSVGRVLQRLKECGLERNTLVIFTSDNGGYINEFDHIPVTSNWPLRSGKGSLYEGGIRVPLVVRWPGVTHAGTVCAEPVANYDLLPTIMAALGLSEAGPRPAQLDGQSLVPLIVGSADHLKRPALFFHFPHYYPTTTPVSAVREGNWKLLEYLEDGKQELYDLAADLGEAHDLAGERPEIRIKLAERLRRWRNGVKAQMPEPNPDFRAAKR